VITKSHHASGRRQQRRRRHTWLYTALIAPTLFSTIGCGGGGVVSTASRAADIVQHAIDAINQAPANWQTELANAEKTATHNGLDVANQIHDLAVDTIAQAGHAVLCVADFFGQRATELLQHIGHSIVPSRFDEPVLQPWICGTNPSQNVDAGKTKLVSYYGYNLRFFAQQANYTARIVYDDNSDAVPSKGLQVDVSTDYQLSVEFQAVDFSSIDRSRHPTLQLDWSARKVQGSSRLAVILPPAVTWVYAFEDFVVNFHVSPNGFLNPDNNCKTIESVDGSGAWNFQITGGWTIDRSKGDTGHGGIVEVSDASNRQAKETLRGYNYQPSSDTVVQITGTTCGAHNAGDGAIFRRTYRVYKMRPAD
jgi:hypothetical protein